MVTSKEITFDEDNECIATVNDKEYDGKEVEIVVKKTGGSEPDTPEADKSVLKLKVVDEKGNPVSGLGLYLKSEEYGSYGDLDIDAATDASGKTSYTYSGKEFGEDTYTVTLKDNSGYEIVTTKEITFDEDDECIATVDDEEYDGNDVVIVVKKNGGSEPEEPETEINEIIPSVSEVSSKGGEVTVTVKGNALPEKMYYAVNYILTGTYTEEEREAITAQEVKTEGSDTERTFKITLPDASKYKGILRWKIGVTDTAPEEGYYYASQQITIKKPVKTGWQKVEGKWYYLNADGEKQAGWQKVDGKWYYMNANGVMQTGWQKVDVCNCP